MPVAVFEEDLPPIRNRNKKRVSFGNELKPLKPHNHNKTTKVQGTPAKSPRSKMTSSEISSTKKSTTTVSGNKENMTTELRLSMKKPVSKIRTNISPTIKQTENKSNALSNFRRSILATMKSPKAATTALLTPIARQHGFTLSSVAPQQTHNAVEVPKTPNSMLSKEMEMSDPDISFLISPCAVGNGNALTSRHFFQSPPKPTHALPPIVEKLEAQSIKPLSKAVTACNLSGTSRFKSTSMKRRIQNSQQSRKRVLSTLSSTHETREPAPSTPYLTRGKGVQMDLSSMFSDFQTPVTSTIPTKEILSGVLEKHSSPVVSIGNMQQGVFLDFGAKIEVGMSKSLPFILEAPRNHSADTVMEIEQLPCSKGMALLTKDPHTSSGKTNIDPFVFTSSFKNPSAIIIKAGENLTLWICWTPVKAGGVRDAITFRLPQGRGRLRITILGCATELSKLKREKISVRFLSGIVTYCYLPFCAHSFSALY